MIYRVQFCRKVTADEKCGKYSGNRVLDIRENKKLRFCVEKVKVTDMVIGFARHM